MGTMDWHLSPGLSHRTWAVAPSASPRAFGVPLFIYVADDRTLVETAVTPLDRPGERCRDLHNVMARITHAPELPLILDGELFGAPRAVIDSVRAHITHKQLVSPEGRTIQPVSIEPMAGVFSTPDGQVPAVAVSSSEETLGLIAIECLDQGADLCVRWVHRNDFNRDRVAFATACHGITHDDLLGTYRGNAELLALEGVAIRLQDAERCLPNLVMGAMIGKITAKLSSGHPAHRHATKLLGALGHIEGSRTPRDYEDYANALSILRQLLELVAEKRVPGKERIYEQLVAHESWVLLYEHIVDAMIVVNRVMDLGSAPSRNDVVVSIERVARQSTDAFTQNMHTARAKILSGLGDLATRMPTAAYSDTELDQRFRLLVHLIGTSGWQKSRPYEYGALGITMGGW